MQHSTILALLYVALVRLAPFVTAAVIDPHALTLDIVTSSAADAVFLCGATNWHAAVGAFANTSLLVVPRTSQTCR